MDLSWLEDFIALADALNFTRAAEARHVTQPAFSRRIQALEGWIGTRLVARSTHGVTLTAAGAHLRGRADALAREVNQLRLETREVAGRETAALSFTAKHALSFTFFPKWIRERERVAPLGAINLISDSMAACEQIMLRGREQRVVALTGWLSTLEPSELGTLEHAAELLERILGEQTSGRRHST